MKQSSYNPLSTGVTASPITDKDNTKSNLPTTNSTTVTEGEVANLLRPEVESTSRPRTGRKRTILLVLSLLVIVYLLFLLFGGNNGANNKKTGDDDRENDSTNDGLSEEDRPPSISTKYAHETQEEIAIYYNTRCFVNIYGFHHTHEEVLFERVRALLPDQSKITTFVSPQIEGMSIQNVLPAPLNHGKGKRMPECGGGKSRAVNQYVCPNFFRSPSNQKYASVDQERYELMKQWKGYWKDPDRLIMLQRSAWFSVYNLNFLLAPHSLNVISMQHPLTWKRVSVGCGEIDHFVNGHTDLPPVPPLTCAVSWLQVWSHILNSLATSRDVVKNFLIVRYESILLDDPETTNEMGAWLKGFAATSPGGLPVVDPISNTTTTIPACSVLDNRAGGTSLASSSSSTDAPLPLEDSHRDAEGDHDSSQVEEEEEATGEIEDGEKNTNNTDARRLRRRRLDNVITPRNIDPGAPTIPMTTAARMNWRHCLWDKTCKRCMRILHEGVIGLGYSLIDEMRPVLTSGVFRVLAHDDPEVGKFLGNNGRAMMRALNQFRNDGECFRLLGLDFE